MSITLCWLLLVTPLVIAFSFSSGNPTECDSLPISWSGGVAPFFLHLVPVFGTPQNISIPAAAFTNGKGSFSVSQLQIPQGHQFLLSMSDSTGFGTGGTTNVLTVGESQGGNCNTADPGVAFSFQLNDALTQCQPYTFSGYATARPPVQIFGMIPSGTSFVLNPPANAAQFAWTANVEHGTSLLFMMTDSLGRQGGASDIRTVANSADSSCLNGNSPSSTSGTPTTTQSRPAQKPTKTSTSSSGAPSSSSSDSASGGTSAGAIAGTVIGALLFIAVAVTLGMFFLKRRKEAAKAPATATGFPSYSSPYNGGHTNGYSLSSTPNTVYTAGVYGSHAPQSPQSYNPYGSELSYGHTYQHSQYAPSVQTQMHNHTLSGAPQGDYDPYQGSMLPYEANPFLNNPHQPQQYPPANYTHQSTYQLPSASAYDLPRPGDPFNPYTLAADRGQPQPPFSPPSTVEDPFTVSELASTSDSTTSAQQRKAAMAGGAAYGPSRIVVHTDAEDVLPPPNAQGVVELPPQYTERRGGRGLTVVNQSPPSPSSSSSPLPPHHQPPSSSA